MALTHRDMSSNNQDPRKLVGGIMIQILPTILFETTYPTNVKDPKRLPYPTMLRDRTSFLVSLTTTRHFHLARIKAKETDSPRHIENTSPCICPPWN